MASLSSSSSPSSSSMKKNMEEEEEKIKLVSLKSFEGKIFQVDELVALQSETIKTMMSEGNGDTDQFPVPNVKSKTLKRVIEYCEKHKHAVDDEASAAEELSAWDSEFVKSFNTNVLLFHLLLASNYLKVKGLTDLIIQRAADLINQRAADLKMPEQIPKTFGDLIIQRVADLINGKIQPEQFRKTFGIKNDFAPGQEEEIIKENPRAFEIPTSKEEHNNNNNNDQDTTTKVLEEKLEKLEIDDNNNQQDKPVVAVVDQED